jgi:DNA repair protein RecN (Recombination protein N)
LIETLRLENLAVVDQAELDFGPGLNVLTGETGAGKSLVLGALALLAGGRASADAIRSGCEQAVVEAVFRTEALPDLERALAERGLDAEDHELVVRRTLTRSGRSRAQVAGQRVPVGTLGQLFADRLEVSSQHDSQALRRPEVHGMLLDRAGGLLKLRKRVSEGYGALRELGAEIDRLRTDAQERARRRDFLAFQVREIDEAELDPEEVTRLEAERGRLAHAERLREEGALALAALAGDPLEADAPAAADRVADAAGRLEALARLDGQLDGLATRLGALREELRDAALELERYLDGVESDPGRLEWIEARLHRIEQLQHKYGPDVAAVLDFRRQAAAELARVEGADARVETLEAECREQAERLASDARDLSDGRARAARRVSRDVQRALRELAMPRAVFAVELVPVAAPEGCPCGPSGAEQAELRFSANPGEPPQPLRRVASGGELSRTVLALRQAIRDADSGMVIVFDEVDAGIGGRAADRVGRTLSELAARHQVLCITHLPQIAARADVHLRVQKQDRRGRTLARIERVEGAERVEEIARMAGGESIAEATRDHARALLGPRATS